MTKAPLVFDKAMQEARHYWRDRLETMSFDGHLALDHPRPRDGEGRIMSFENKIESGVEDLLERVTQGNPFLRYACLFAALQICCSRHSGVNSVTIFSPAEAGAVANLLPFGSVLDPAAPFKSVMLNAKELLAAGYQRQQYPFSRLLLDLPDQRRPKSLHLIAALEGFNGPFPQEEADIGILFRENSQGMTALIRFNALLYEEQTVRSFVQYFGELLRAGLSATSTRVDELAIGAVTGEARRAALRGRETVQARIASVAAETPERIAIVEGCQAITYGMLATRMREVGESIASSGVVSGTVGIMLGPGADFVAAAWAALETGGSFAPIRPLASSHSLEESLKALGCALVVCREEDLRHVEEAGLGLRGAITVGPAGARTVVFDGGSGGVVTTSDGRPACVLLNSMDETLSTSALSHDELLTVFDSIGERCGIRTSDRCLLTPTLGLCDQIFDMLGMLAAGASVEIPDRSSADSASALVGEMASEGITVWHLPTAVMQNVLGEIREQCTHSPRAIILSGENQCPQTYTRLQALFSEARIVGVYGPPDLQLWTTVFASGESAEPIPGFVHRVLNASGAEAPPFTKGALWIERQFAEGPAIATGLRAQRLENGRMRWLRGADHSFVKYGCRIELTAIEAALCRHDSVRGVEAFTVSDGGGPQQLAAFVFADGSLSAEAARDFLVLHGGVDLIPDHFIVLGAAPVSAEGAIDRVELTRRCVPTEERIGDSKGAAAETQLKLKEIWLEVLEAADVEEDASFFTVGGNSLKATLLIARVRSEFRVDVSVQSFFRKPTLHAVAQLIAADSANGVARQSEPELEVVSREKYRVQFSP